MNYFVELRYDNRIKTTEYCPSQETDWGDAVRLHSTLPHHNPAPTAPPHHSSDCMAHGCQIGKSIKSVSHGYVTRPGYDMSQGPSLVGSHTLLVLCCVLNTCSEQTTHIVRMYGSNNNNNNNNNNNIEWAENIFIRWREIRFTISIHMGPLSLSACSPAFYCIACDKPTTWVLSYGLSFFHVVS